jgi:preprotein translocase subunit SecA
VEYKRESFDMLRAMLERVQDRVVKVLYKTEIVVEDGAAPGQRPGARPAPAAQLPLPTAPKARDLVFSAPSKEMPAPQKRKEAKVGRNDPCPCGSGKKYKKCHGVEATA